MPGDAADQHPVLSASDGGTVVLRIDDVPPSLNAFGSGDKWKSHAARKRWGTLIEEQLIVATAAGELPSRVEQIAARAIITFYRKGSWDEGNFRHLLEKVLGDCLDGGRHRTRIGRGKGSKVIKHFPDGRWIVNDTSAHFRFTTVEFVSEELVMPEWAIASGMSKADYRKSQPRGRTEIRMRYWH